jgi:hypothetical protein
MRETDEILALKRIIGGGRADATGESSESCHGRVNTNKRTKALSDRSRHDSRVNRAEDTSLER